MLAQHGAAIPALRVENAIVAGASDSLCSAPRCAAKDFARRPASPTSSRRVELARSLDSCAGGASGTPRGRLDELDAGVAGKSTDLARARRHRRGDYARLQTFLTKRRSKAGRKRSKNRTASTILDLAQYDQSNQKAGMAISRAPMSCRPSNPRPAPCPTQKSRCSIDFLCQPGTQNGLLSD